MPHLCDILWGTGTDGMTENKRTSTIQLSSVPSKELSDIPF